MSKKIRLTRIIGRVGDVAHDLNRLQFMDFRSPVGWQPDITVYQYEDSFEIWVELAGVDKQDIRIQALSDRITVSGERRPPVPTYSDIQRCQVVTMEIECGRFSREIMLPAEILPHQVVAKQENGLLRIILPLA